MFKFFYTLFFALISSVVFGQILNVEKRRGDVDENGWKGNVDVSIKYTENTRSIFEFFNKSTINYKKDSVTYLFLTDFKLIKKNSDDLINKGGVHLRRIQDLNTDATLKSELFTQVQFNGVQKIKQRFLLGAGARAKLVGNDTINCNFSIGGMYEYEETTIETFHHALRMTSYLSFNWDLNEKWKLRLINYYQPKVNLLNDFRLSNETSLSYQVSKEFSVVATYSLLYDSTPVLEVPNQVYSGYLLLRYKF
ncbi:MAG: DUF481 domain-containing protein [Flavobacteriales bacterium]|jgi:hypothetical protein|nr:DUF481 domain-containing protein [Flavobacteriales bacterium]